jgi:predicted nucleic acid-binding protein
MKSMTDKVFIDTNVILYAKFNDGSRNFQVANNLFKTGLLKSEAYISTQVVNEFCVNAIKKGIIPQEVHNTALQFSRRFYILPVTMKTVTEGFRLYNRYQFSYWDSLIVAAALEAGCGRLYSEDLSDGQIIDKSLEIINPFRR